MSTYIEFPNGDKVHIYDRFVHGKTVHIVIETGHIYQRESTAIKRSILSYRKRMYGSTLPRRRRERIIHYRGQTIEASQPTIKSFYEDGILYHMVLQTGKKYKKLKKAMKKAFEYVQYFSK